MQERDCLCHYTRSVIFIFPSRPINRWIRLGESGEGIIETDSAFTRIAEQYHVEHVVYSHCHGESRFGDSIRGEYHGIMYHLVSGDYLNFCPERIL